MKELAVLYERLLKKSLDIQKCGLASFGFSIANVRDEIRVIRSEIASILGEPIVVDVIDGHPDLDGWTKIIGPQDNPELYVDVITWDGTEQVVNFVYENGDWQNGKPTHWRPIPEFEPPKS